MCFVLSILRLADPWMIFHCQYHLITIAQIHFLATIMKDKWVKVQSHQQLTYSFYKRTSCNVQ